MKHLPYWITTRSGRKYRTAYGLRICRNAKLIDAWDSKGNQHLVHVADVKKHSAGTI